MTSFYGMGVMSGTSLDGLDLCFVEFTGDHDTDIWGYRIDLAITIPYSSEMKERLESAKELSGIDLVLLNKDYSHLVGQNLQNFIEHNDLRPDFIASHGHTVFHQPDKGLTFALGEGEIISTYIRCPFISNFRAKDIALGGQGAPLVPCGEKFLFQQTHVCVSLGGIANLGVQGDKGYDVCPCNMVLNRLASSYDKELEFDKDGAIAAKGEVLQDVLDDLNKLDYYQQMGPKSIGSEWVSSTLLPVLEQPGRSVPDLMRTFVAHIAEHVTKATKACIKNLGKESGTVMVTGGGAYNKTLMQELTSKLKKNNVKVVDTENELVEYKEAVVVAFLGLRSLLIAENVFSSVTGSKADTISGSIHHGTKSYNRPKVQNKFNFLIRTRNAGVNDLAIGTEK